MRILKNNLYIQEKAKKKFLKTPLLHLFESYKNTITNQINLENNNKLLPQLIYNQNNTKNTKKLKKITYISLLNLILKKLIFFSTSYKKLLVLLDTWIINNYTKYINCLNSLKITNSKLIFFYIKKKCTLLFSIIEKLKINYLNQFAILFFKTNKKLKLMLDKQLDLDLLKNKNINALVQKIKTILYTNITAQLKNKHFFNDFLTILKSLKKELISTFFETTKKNINEKKNIKYLNNNFFNLFIKKNYKTNFNQFKQTVEKYKFSNINQINEYYQHVQNPLFYVITEKKEKNENIMKWIFFNIILKDTNNFIIKYVYKIVIENNIKNKITNIEKKIIPTIKKEKYINFLLQNNIFAHLSNSKNTKSIFYNFNKNLHYINSTIENKEKWYTDVINQYIKSEKYSNDSIKKKKIKKNINLLYTNIINASNKKYGITYNCLLVNDNLSYWTKDYNTTLKKQNHLQLITDIQKHTYKVITIKYINNTINHLYYVNNKIINYVSYIQEKIKKNTKNILISKSTITQLNI